MGSWGLGPSWRCCFFFGGGRLKIKQPSWRQWLSEGMPLKVLLGLPVIPPPISTQNDLRPPPGHTPSTMMSCSRAHGLNVTKFHAKPLRCFFSGFDHSKCRSNSLHDCAVSLQVFSSPPNILPFCQRKTWFLHQAVHVWGPSKEITKVLGSRGF